MKDMILQRDQRTNLSGQQGALLHRSAHTVGLLPESMGSRLSADPQSLQIIDVSEHEEDVFTLRVSLKQPGRKRRRRRRRRKKEEEEEVEPLTFTVFWLKVTLI